MLFEPKLSFALNRLEYFASQSADLYAEKRNYDLGAAKHSNVSMLSPYIRHKVIKEPEVIKEVLKQCEHFRVEKFLDEVLWRTYWKGWLEMHPAIWSNYLDSLKKYELQFKSDQKLLDLFSSASRAESGIESFDYWARELLETGYLHNHARMWFASIWVFTLNLPWELGADFFYKNLFDADPASNTLSWRWVAGLHTKGKHYVATESNIVKYCKHQFSQPIRLAENPSPITENNFNSTSHRPKEYASSFPAGNFCLLVTEENLKPDLNGSKPEIIAVLATSCVQRMYNQNPKIQKFKESLQNEMTATLSKELDVPVCYIESSDQLISTALSYNCNQIFTSFSPLGPVSSLLANFEKELSNSKIDLVQVIESWESELYTFAKKGFFDFRKSSREAVNKLIK